MGVGAEKGWSGGGGTEDTAGAGGLRLRPLPTAANPLASLGLGFPTCPRTGCGEVTDSQGSGATLPSDTQLPFQTPISAQIPSARKHTRKLRFSSPRPGVLEGPPSCDLDFTAQTINGVQRGGSATVSRQALLPLAVCPEASSQAVRFSREGDGSPFIHQFIIVRVPGAALGPLLRVPGAPPLELTARHSSHRHSEETAPTEACVARESSLDADPANSY